MVGVWVFRLIVGLIIAHTPGAKSIKQKPNAVPGLVIVVISPGPCEIYLVYLPPPSVRLRKVRIAQ
jgi:hypothetical protein